jgi:outer membrane protein OmpA-like peptidoglycan-associated protein
MSRFIFVPFIVLGLAFTLPASAQEPSTEDVVEALVPKKQFRGPRGLSIEGEDKPPSIDLHIPFEYDSDKLTTEAILKRLGAALKDTRLNGYRFKIAGHTDAKGSAEYNQKLSERRAAAVRDYLVFQYDLEPDRIEVIGFGKTQLADRRWHKSKGSGYQYWFRSLVPQHRGFDGLIWGSA